MSQFVLSNSEIEGTQVFQKLEPCFQTMALKAVNKNAISQALVIYRNSGMITGSLGGNNLKILKELIEKEQKN